MLTILSFSLFVRLWFSGQIASLVWACKKQKSLFHFVLTGVSAPVTVRIDRRQGLVILD